jgi:hypothetical protein
MRSPVKKNPLQLYGMKPAADKPSALHIPLPAFVTKKEIGLGNLIGRATSAIGIKPCGSCKKRAAALDKKVVFGPARKK